MGYPAFDHAHTDEYWNASIPGTTNSDMLYTETTIAEGYPGGAADCWVEIELPAGTYEPIMTHTGNGTELYALVWRGSSWQSYEIASTQKELPNGVLREAEWLDSFTITTTTRVRFCEKIKVVVTAMLLFGYSNDHNIIIRRNSPQ